MVILQFLSNSSLRPVTETFAHATFVLVAIVKKIFGLKIILTWHLSKPKIYQDHKFFGLNTSLDPQFIGTNIFLDPQVFVPKIILTPKNFTSKHFLDPTFFCTLKIFWTKISLDQFFFEANYFFTPIFFHPKFSPVLVCYWNSVPELVWFWSGFRYHWSCITLLFLANTDF